MITVTIGVKVDTVEEANRVLNALAAAGQTETTDVGIEPDADDVAPSDASTAAAAAAGGVTKGDAPLL